MEHYNAVAVLEGTVTDERIDNTVSALSAFAPAVAEDNGRLEVTMTFAAENGPQAAATALAVVAQNVPGLMRSLHVLPTEDYDALVDRLDDVPSLSVAEAADRLNMSRQAVHKAIEAGRLRARTVGGRWSISETSINEFAAARDTSDPDATAPQRKPHPSASR